MKIVIIHGQSHKGISYNTGRSLVEKLKATGDISEFFMPKDMDGFCSGCLACMHKGEEFCPHYDKLKPITEAMDQADLLVFTTPVYCMRTTGSMKAFLDHCFVRWLSHRPKAEMFFKQAVVISVAAGVGMKEAASDIKVSLGYWGISNVQTYKVHAAASSWETVSKKLKAKIEHDMRGLASRIEKKEGRVRVSAKSKFMFGIMRMMQLKDWSACPQDKEYWVEKGWLGSERPWKKKKIAK